MYIEENDNRTPRERVDDSVLRRMLGGADGILPAPADGGQQKRELPCNPDGGKGARPVNYYSLGMVYSPTQSWREVYDVDTALARGTMFRELDMPWEVPAPTGKGGCRCD